MILQAIIPIITIWIHGTRPTECVPKFLKDAVCGIENVLFIDQKTTGLVPLSQVNDREYIVELAKHYCLARQGKEEDFYFFAWSGNLNPKARKVASEQLYKELCDLIKRYQKQYGVTPFVEIVSHSHGGNVALLLADQHAKFALPDFSVDRLILLGCPVQKATKGHVASPIFKKIYNLHSHNDWIQVLDPQGVHLFAQMKEEFTVFDILNNFFSSRHFDIESDNLTQVHVRWNVRSDQADEKRHLFPLWLQKRLEYAAKLPMKRGLFHIEFTLHPFARRLFQLIEEIEKGDKQGIKKKEAEIILL